MNQFDILLNLINFKLIMIVPHIGMILFLLAILQSLCAIEEIIPIEVLIILGEVIIEGDCLSLGYAQFMAHHVN